MSGPTRILLVDDEPTIRVSASDMLSAKGYSVTVVGTGQDALGQIDAFDFDIAVLDLRLPDASGLDLLRRLVELRRTTDVVMITAYGTIPTAVEAMKLGARDFLTKPFDLAQLIEVVTRYARVREARHRSSEARCAGDFHGIVGESPAMCELVRIVRAVADGSAPILIHGETGTGKSLVARAIHAASPRSNGDFVVVRCALVTDASAESELFAGEPERPLERARGGTLFLDEIAELEAPVQARLTYALQADDPRFGGPLDYHIVASTRFDLRGAADSGAFRQDLFFRLNVLPIAVPPLRERGTDVYLLADLFLERHNAQSERPTLRFSPGARRALGSHAWPGNVRELQNAIARAVALCPDEVISPDHLGLDVQRLVTPLSDTMRAEEDRRIDAALAQTGGRKAEAAELLGISRKTLWEKLKRRRG